MGTLREVFATCLMRFLFATILVAAPVFAADEIDFHRDIRPVLSKNCYFCHGPDAEERKADLRLDTYEGAIEDRDGARAIDPADLADSEFIYRIKTDDEDDLMPPRKSHKQLTSAEIDLLTRWVEAGAEYKDHWAFVTPQAAALAPVEWGRNPIDAFVFEDLEQSGLAPSPEARADELIRRLSLDLTGLPPAPERVEAFVQAHAKNPEQAYEELVDEILASAAYGERMALAWMDLARYGDTSVMHADGPREMWHWRDWVINSYNDNKPFSDFLREQLAGDLLPDATRAQKIASGFNRNHATSDEGGAFPEELRVDYVVDRVQTTANVFLGLSMECAQCHDHKYDPISHKEYFEFFAYFNNNADSGMQSRKGNAAPMVEFSTGIDEAAVSAVDAKLKAQDAKAAERRKQAGPGLKKWLAAAKPEEVLPPEPTDHLHRFLFDDLDFLEGEENPAEIAVITKREGAGAAIKFKGKKAIAPQGLETTPNLPLDSPFTVAYWVRMPAKAPGASAIASDFGPNFRGWDLYFSGRRPVVHILQSWPGNGLKVSAKKEIPADQWAHVSFTYDGSRKAKGITLRVDGVKQDLKLDSDNAKPDASNDNEAPFLLGGRGGNNFFKGEVDDIRFYDRVLEDIELSSLCPGPVPAALATAEAERTPEQTKLLTEHFFAAVDKPSMSILAGRKVLEEERADLTRNEKKFSSMIMGDLPENKKRLTYILDRGQYDAPKKDEPVEPGVPAFLPEFPADAPANRLGLADWMLLPDHPLTARVTVNRYWAMLFGRGLTPSISDFGNQGAMPTHPELLDWMARDFIDSGWDVKRTLRQIVTSSTYRQTAAPAPGLREADPENLLLGRAPRFRIQGEFVRDFALAASGLLEDEIGGPGVKPYQPAGLWNEVSINKGLHFTQDKGEKLYRKSMYTYWKRSAPHPGMTIMDAPTREKCTVQRARTNTPLQALYTLNDVQFVEASRALAERMIKEGGQDLAGRIDRAFQICVSRSAEAREQEILQREYEDQLASFQAEPERAKAYLAHGESPRDESIPVAEHAALAVVANLILNLDETLTRD